MADENKAELFDENKATKLMDLYSRQIGTYGVETMKNLVELRVLVVGLQGMRQVWIVGDVFLGVGVETAKNIILAGPAAVTLYDEAPVTIADLGTNFFFSEESIGQKRAEVCLEPLQRLNPYVNVSVHSGFVPNFSHLILCSVKLTLKCCRVTEL